MFTSKRPTCAGRTLDLPRKDRDIRYLRSLGNSDIAGKRTALAPSALRLSPGEDPSARLTQIAEENARFNIGDVVRTLNEPTFALMFLRPRNRDRMRFVSLGEERIGDLLTWVVGYREVPLDGTTFIGTENEDSILTRGRFWIEPASGRVVQSELITGDARIERTGTITVRYRLVPAVNLWLPAQMQETYESTETRHHSPTITGTATYSNYRVLPPAIASLTVAGSQPGPRRCRLRSRMGRHGRAPWERKRRRKRDAVHCRRPRGGTDVLRRGPLVHARGLEKSCVGGSIGRGRHRGRCPEAVIASLRLSDSTFFRLTARGTAARAYPRASPQRRCCRCGRQRCCARP